MKFNLKYVYVLLASIALVSCQTLEDTYAEYAGDGSIRYVGTPTDMTIAPKWGELNVEWVNSIDPNIDSLLVKWSYTTNDNTYEFSKKLPGGETKYTIPVQEMHDEAIAGEADIIDKIVNVTTEVKVISIDIHGTESKSATIYSRPYNPLHEEVLAYPLLVSSSFSYNGTGILFFSQWNQKVETLKISYQTSAGTQELNYTSDNLPADVLLPGLTDPNITIERYGYLGNIDTENPENNVMRNLVNEVSLVHTFSSGWDVLLNEKFPSANGIFDDNFRNSITELDIDFAIVSLNELLAFPNLEKLNFGKNRYMGVFDYEGDALYSPDFYGSVTDVEVSKRTLEIIEEINGGLELNFYGRHFEGIADVNVTDKHKNGFTLHPTNLNYIQFSNAKKDYEDVEGQNTYFNRLYDGQLSTFWNPLALYGDARTYQFTFTLLGDLQTITGFEVTQQPVSSANDLSQMPSSVSIEVSTDEAVWVNATGEDTVRLGTSPNESSIIYIHPSLANNGYKYVRLTVNDNPIANGNYLVTLAEFRVIK